MTLKERFGGLSRTDLLIVLVALVYILSPFDAVPEAITGPLGLTDDLAAAVLIGTTVLRSRGTPAPAPQEPGGQSAT